MSDDAPTIHNLFIPSTSRPVPVLGGYRERHYVAQTPIVIDNGSTTLRAGFCTSTDPHIIVDNMQAKYRDRKSNALVLLFGNDLPDDATTRSNSKSPFDGDLCVNPEVAEAALDWTFLKLGIDSEKVNHPIVMTERLCTPLQSRAFVSELLFEAYNVPSVIYGPDGFFSMMANATNPITDGVVVSFNTNSTNVWPVLGGRNLLDHAKRIPWGGTQAAELMLRFIQLKYPTFPTRVTLTQATWLLHNFGEFAPVSYMETVRELSNPLKLAAYSSIIQFPFTATLVEEKTQEEIDRLAEKRREAGRRLQETSARIRLEKLIQKEADLEYYNEVREWKNKEKRSDYLKRVENAGFESEQQLDTHVKKLDAAVQAARKKQMGIEDPVDDTPPSWPLVDRPDHELNEEEIKEKKKQRLLKAGYDARQRARREKEKEAEILRAQEQREEQERGQDLQGWSRKLRREHDATMDKIKERKKRQLALTDRKSMAAQQRMRSIAALATDQPQIKRRKKNTEDLFGANDDDWAIYRKIQNASDSSDEEEDFARINVLEAKLLAHDPSFLPSATFAARSNERSALMNAFRPTPPEDRMDLQYQMHLNTERLRVPEAWFSPPIAGVDSAGLGEVLTSMLKAFEPHERDRLIRNIHVTGGPSQIKGIAQRLHSEIAPVLPVGAPLSVRTAKDARLDAWRGMAQFAQSDELLRVSMTRSMYNEWGPERTRLWRGGNWNGAVDVP